MITEYLQYIRRVASYTREGLFAEKLANKIVRMKRKRCNASWDAQPDLSSFKEVEVDPDIRMRLYRDSILARLIYCNDFERAEREFVKAFLKSGDTFVDVGANIGLFSLIAARAVGPGGSVYGFEPATGTFARYLENIKLNSFSNIRPNNIALSHTTGKLPFYNFLDGFDAWSSLAPPADKKDFEIGAVQSDTWDNFAKSKNLVGKTSLIKIDIEGWEINFLKGAGEVLSRADAPVLMVEFADDMAESAGFKCTDLYRGLESLGYKMYRYNPVDSKLTEDPPRPLYPYDNLICVKELNRVKARLINFR